MVNTIWRAIERLYGGYMIFIMRLCLWNDTNFHAFKDTHIDNGRYYYNLVNTDAKSELEYLHKIKANNWVYLDYWLGAVRGVILICGAAVLFIILIKNGWYIKGSMMDMVFSRIAIFK